jgi:hypothetical protein
MNTNELRIKLDKLGINPNFYSLDGELLPDRIVLYNLYSEWQVFYFDERGNRDNEKIFNSEQKACEYIDLAPI